MPTNMKATNERKSHDMFSPGLEVKLKGQHYPVIIAATHVPELLLVETLTNGVRVGASTTLSSLKELLEALVNSEPGTH